MESAGLELDDYGLLSPGDHVADMAAIRASFGTTPQRAALLDAFESIVVPEAAALGFEGGYLLDGSFVTREPEPADLDVILDAFDTPDEIFVPVARLVIRDHDDWHARLHVDVHIRHPRIPKDIGTLFRRISLKYAARYDVPAGTCKGLIRWQP